MKICPRCKSYFKGRTTFCKNCLLDFYREGILNKKTMTTEEEKELEEPEEEEKEEEEGEKTPDSEEE